MHPDAIAQIRQLQHHDLAILRDVISASKACLQRDDDGDWWIKGERGYVTSSSGSFTICIDERWRSARRALCDFTIVISDYRDAGTLQFTRLPADDEAALLRDALGIRAARPHAADHLHAREGIA
jgi:hypothetical protein